VDYEHSVEIDAPTDVVWAALMDVERWPEWTDSMRRVERLDDGDLQVGSIVRIKQPRIAVMEWRVTDLQPGQSFSWTASRGGVTTIATHEVVPSTTGAVVKFGIDQSGPLVGLVSFFTAGMTKRYLRLEAAGLKHRCESA
jgi:uncharacterized protein YndB with AHSA1/START domain